MGQREGKQIEREFARELREVFEEAERNFEDRVGKGYDIENTYPFKFQVKYGHAPSPYKAINQACSATEEDEYGVGLLKFRHSARKDPENGRASMRLAILRFEDFMEIISKLKAEGII